MGGSNSNVLATVHFSRATLEDFEAFSAAVLGVLQQDFGFSEPLVLMKEVGGASFTDASGSQRLSRNDDGVCGQAIRTREMASAETWMAMPLLVVDDCIGVLAFSGAASLSALELSYLRNFAAQIAPHLWTTWLMHQNSDATPLQRKGHLLGLMEIETFFLREMQDLLLRSLQREGDPERRARLLDNLTYLNSVLLLSGKMLGDDGNDVV